MKTPDESETLHRMAAYCSSGERCRQDVEKKLSSSGLSPDSSEKILTRLVEERFIDEERYAKSFTNDKLRFNGWGRFKIAYELKYKNIPAEIINESLKNIDNVKYQTILFDLLKSKKKSIRGKDEREIYLKLLRFASGRGFESHETQQCLKKLFSGNSYEDDFD